MKKLKVITERTINLGGQKHLLVEGDNIDGLNALLNEYKSSIDVIYIDPPYNLQGKHFVYNDSLSHKEWREFMETRLIVAKELMTDQAVIFISIDDYELAHLKILCDEIFGEENFIANIINHVGGGKNNRKGIATKHEYILSYSKTNNPNLIGKLETTTEKLSLLRKGGDADKQEDRPTMHFPIYYSPDTKEISLEPFPGSTEIIPIRPNGSNGRWRWGKKRVQEKSNDLVVKQNTVYVKENAGRLKETPFSSLIDFPTMSGTKAIQEIFGEKVFDYPKPVELIKFLLRLINNKSAVVLDFFAGSGTTGHAVLELNKEDGGNRKFILITKLTDGQDNNDICYAITYKRLVSVMKGYTGALNERQYEGTGGSLEYLTID